MNDMEPTFDSNSGKTLCKNGPWMTLSARQQKKKEFAASEKTQKESACHHSQGQNTNDGKPQGAPQKYLGHNNASKRFSRWPTVPSLPENHYKIVYRPQAGMKVSNLKDGVIVRGLAQACGVTLQELYAKVIIQTQWHQNLILASTEEEECALKLAQVTHIQIGQTAYEVTPYLKPIPDTVRGVVHGIEEGTTDEQLEDLLAMNNCKILYARMLGRSTSAVITFEGPHVPFYVKVGCTLSRCRPYRKSVQYCRSCGEIGHRQDVCPNPNDDICDNCGEQNADPNNHKCELKCKLCGMPHETASRECRRKLKPAPPPLRVRERSRSRQRSFGYQNNVVTMNDNDHAVSLPPRDETNQERLSRPKSRSRSRGRERSVPSTTPTDVEPDNVQRKLSWANVVTGHSHSSMESTSTPTTKHYTYEETITILRRENEELRQALELQKKKTQEKEASTEKQLEYLMREIEQLRREQTQNSQTPPSRPPSPPPSSPPQPKPATLANQTKVTQNDLRVLEDRINANMTVVMDDIMSKVSQVVETTVTQLLQTGFQTLKSEMENQIRALETKMTQSGESFSQRIHTLEERENARKKPKYPVREAEILQTLSKKDGEAN
ncbi:hypothetical protein HPB52_016840 [Rhipicephalus sanguineus]|uniref:CCHC-type domain-containing protein n=1 Tax=Rhipicephalus sanguineus TaxID=34632 RepID=A0A9D4PPP5_RHISA|nr:hypothetical protein HPB52_016840 [Rhipicephalus sanguineus]